MRIKSEKDFWSGVLFMVLGLAFAWDAMGRRFGDAVHLGPGALPFALGGLLALLGALTLFKAVVVEAEGGDRIGPLAWRPLAAAVGATALFGLSAPHLGLLPALALLVLTASLGDARIRLREALLGAALLTLAAWAVVGWGLRPDLPLWPAAALQR